VDDDRRAAIDDAVCRALGRFADRATIDAPELAELLGVARATGYEMVSAASSPRSTAATACSSPCLDSSPCCSA
jgi:hypothetical protein